MHGPETGTIPLRDEIASKVKGWITWSAWHGQVPFRCARAALLRFSWHPAHCAPGGAHLSMAKPRFAGAQLPLPVGGRHNQLKRSLKMLKRILPKSMHHRDERTQSTRVDLRCLGLEHALARCWVGDLAFELDVVMTARSSDGQRIKKFVGALQFQKDIPVRKALGGAWAIRRKIIQQVAHVPVTENLQKNWEASIEDEIWSRSKEQGQGLR